MRSSALSYQTAKACPGSASFFASSIRFAQSGAFSQDRADRGQSRQLLLGAHCAIVALRAVENRLPAREAIPQELGQAAILDLALELRGKYEVAG